MSSTPAVTVLMPVYNAARYLREAIASILCQTFEDFEFLIIDDGSTDDSRAIVQSYDDPRIRLVFNPRNLGIVESLNRGLGLASGEFVARMDADDRALPHRLRRQVTCLQVNPTVGLVGSAVETVDERGRRRLMVRRVPTSHDLICWNLLFENCITHCSVMVRRSSILAVGGYTRGSWAEDYDLWVRMSRVCRLAQLADVLQQFRLNRTGAFLSHLDQHEEWVLRVMEEQSMRLLGRQMPRETLECLRLVSRFKPQPSGDAVTRTGAILLEYFEKFVKSCRVVGAELHRLRADVGGRLLSLASVNLRRFPISALGVAVTAARFGPRSLLHGYTMRGVAHGIGGPDAVERLKRVLTRA